MLPPYAEPEWVSTVRQQIDDLLAKAREAGASDKDITAIRQGAFNDANNKNWKMVDCLQKRVNAFVNRVIE